MKTFHHKARKTSPLNQQLGNLGHPDRYQNSSGDFADFHSNRHTFISRLGRQGVPLGVAQKLARYSDPRLTSNLYTHLELSEKASAIAGLEHPQPTATEESDEIVVTGMVTEKTAADRPSMSKIDNNTHVDTQPLNQRKSLNNKTLGHNCHQESTSVKIHPRGFEPLTSGSVDRCSIQLS